jgi:hypothetical protein
LIGISLCPGSLLVFRRNRMIRLPFVLATALVLGAPALAQTAPNPADQPSRPLPYDPGHDSTSARSDAIAAETAPGVAAANNEVAAQASPSAIDPVQVTKDRMAYRAAVRARHRTIAVDAAIQEQREAAYAAAMADWRAQVAACERGKTRACKLPTPNPQDYM